jgi:murein DD-endopeptidase MepM/ murein hydrolase activator NlpD
MSRLGLALLIALCCAGLVGRAAGEASTSQVHIVKKGETLLKIAQRYGIQVDQLRQWNSLRSNRLAIGQRLVLLEQNQTQTQKKKKVEKDPLAATFSTWKESVIDRSRRSGHYALVVNKTQRRMEVYKGGKQVTTFPVAIGFADAWEMTDRRVAEDHHLKEGVFHLSEVAWSNSIAKWDRVWMRIHTVEWAKKDYVKVYGQAGKKRLEAWEAQNGPIYSDTDVRAFNGHNRRAPIWRGLGIHGGGSKPDWTDGCIALDRKDIRWLYYQLKKMPNGGVGTPLAVVRF